MSVYKFRERNNSEQFAYAIGDTSGRGFLICEPMPTESETKLASSGTLATSGTLALSGTTLGSASTDGKIIIHREKDYHCLEKEGYQQWADGRPLSASADKALINQLQSLAGGRKFPEHPDSGEIEVSPPASKKILDLLMSQSTQQGSWPHSSLADILKPLGNKGIVIASKDYTESNPKFVPSLKPFVGNDINRIVVVGALKEAVSILKERNLKADFVIIFSRDEDNVPQIWNNFAQTDSFTKLGDLTNHAPLVLSICNGSSVKYMSDYAKAYAGDFWVTDRVIEPYVTVLKGFQYLFEHGDEDNQNVFFNIYTRPVK